MKNGEIYGAQMTLNETLKTSNSAKLIYGVNKNIERAEREIKLLDAIRKPSDKYLEFDQKRVQLCIASAAKGDDGQPKTVITGIGREYDIVDRPAFDKALEALRVEYLAAIEAHKAALERFNSHMDAESEMKIYKIKYSMFEKEQAELKSEDRLNGEQVKQIWFMLEDDMETETADSKPELKMVK